jgi:transketolase
MPLNPDQKLNHKLFDKTVDSVSMRQGFGDGLVLAGRADKNVVALCADLTESLHMQAFKDKFANRFIEMGVAEQNLVTVASGMAAMGKIPFAGSYAVFSPGRNWEQIRTTICLNNVPVKIIGSHVGVTVGPDGASHQMLEDIALMRALPNMVVISPCDAIEARKATIAAAKNGKPTYIRLTRDKTPVITSDHTPFEIGKASIVFASDILNQKSVKYDVGIIATGHLLYKALKVAKQLEGEGKKVTVMNLATIKPLDEHAIIKLAQDAGVIVTVEEHQISGGMGSAVAECLAKNHPVPIEFIGVKDQFGQSGKADELLEHYGMGEKDIYTAVQKVLLRKK